MTQDPTTEERIISAAKAVFLEKGMAGARMQDIADRAGINKALLHYYFRSKDKLFQIIFQESIQTFLPKIRLLMVESKNVEQFIRQFVPTYMDMLRLQPYLATFIINEINQHPAALWDIMKGNEEKPFPFEAFSSLVEREVASGTIRPIDPRQLWTHMMGLCIFPFLAKPMLSMLLQLDAIQFDQFLDERREEIIHFITTSLQP